MSREAGAIHFCPAFRRLQDKTQVFPLAKSDYVRTRLTHSLEVASVGRSMGMLAAEAVLENHPDLTDVVVPQDLGTIVSTACLAHDIGNPPFGHAGESAIQEWFQSSSFIEDLTSAEREDLLRFEGNAQGFRTLAVLQQAPLRGGLQLTCAVLGAFTKYPRESVVEASQRQGVSGKKFGFMQSEAEDFAEVAEELGLQKKPGAGDAWFRHPLAFLVEAADDICYHIMDVEDGFKAGCLSSHDIEELHRPFVDEKRWEYARKEIRDIGRRVEYFRAVSVDRLARDMVNVWRANLDGLMAGSFDSELAKCIELSAEFQAFKNLAKEKVYSTRVVVEVEACGFDVLAGLLGAFVGAIRVAADGGEERPARARTMLRLMPKAAHVNYAELSRYEQVLLATDFVSGMTDSFAVELYQRIRGISLPR